MSLTKLQAELYVLTHRGNAGDMEFYTRACSAVASVLELGTGYGRLLPALTDTARCFVGLERDPQLLALARLALKRLLPAKQRAGKFVRGDMQKFELGRKFERIILPYNGLYCLLQQRALLACFRSVRAHLAPGGEFLFDVWAADNFHHQQDSNAYRDDTGPILAICRGAQTWDVFETSRLQKQRQRLDVIYSYVQRERATRVTIGIEQRYALSSEIFELLGQAGLEVLSAHGGFAGQRFGARSTELVVRAG